MGRGARLALCVFAGIVCAMLTLTAAGAHAQIDSGTRPAVAVASDPDRAHRVELARQLIELDGTAASIEALRTQMVPLLDNAMRSEDSFRQLPQADQDKILEYVQDEFENYFLPQLKTMIPDYYADYMSAADLKAVVTAYQTPAMKAYVAVHTAMGDALETQSNDLGRQCAQRAIQRYIAWKTAKGT